MPAAEKRDATRLVEESDFSVRRTLRELQIPRATFYRWYRRYAEAGMDGLVPRRGDATVLESRPGADLAAGRGSRASGA